MSQTGTEPGSLNYRVPEVVTVLVAGLAHAQPHPQTDGFSTLAVAPFDALLHADGAPQGCRCRTEHHHQSVTEVLDLGAARFGDGLPQE